MWIGFDAPRDIAWSISGGTFAGDSDGSHLTNGDPQSRTRFQWPAGAQTTDTAVVLTGTHASAPIPEIGALLNVSLPPGTRIQLQVRIDGTSSWVSPGGNATNYRTVRRADQSVALVWGFERLYSAPSPSRPDWDFNVTGVRLTIFNDVNGVASIPASSFTDLGELITTPAYYIPLRRTIQSRAITAGRRRGGDNSILPRRRFAVPMREETYDIRTIDWSAIGNDQTKLRAILERADLADRVLFIPRWHLPDVDASRPWELSPYVDYATLNDSAVFGVISSREPIKLVEDFALDTSITIAELG